MNQQLIEQYVSGRMSEDDARAFEEYCLAHPEFARQVELEQRLRAGLSQVARDSTTEFVRAPHAARWTFAAAAGVVFALVASFWLWQKFDPASEPAVMTALTSAGLHPGPTLRLALVRGTDTTPTLPPGHVRVDIVGLFDVGAPYSVALDRLDVKRNIDTIATLYGQHPTTPVTLAVLLDADRLEPGTYSLRVRKQSSSEEALDFEFLKR